MKFLQKIKFNQFVLLIILAVILAIICPMQGRLEFILKYISQIGIAILFFMHGAKLSRRTIISGITHWQMHLFVFLLTFVTFPVLGLLLRFLPENILQPNIYNGFLFLCALPSTVQSSIILTSTARGNIAGAICSASISSLLGVFISPFLVGMLMNTHLGIEIHFIDSVKNIFLQLMLPFLIGHLSRPFIEKWLQNNTNLIKITDQSSILLVVYIAFSKAIIDGLWFSIGIKDIIIIFILSVLILFLIISLARYFSKKLKFKIEDEITIVMCGSKKSLVNGVPMANILFPPTMVGILILPLMIFHQVQLIICAIIAQKYAHRD